MGARSLRSAIDLAAMPLATDGLNPSSNRAIGPELLQEHLVRHRRFGVTRPHCGKVFVILPQRLPHGFCDSEGWVMC